MDLEELYHKYRIRLKQSLFTTFATIGLVVCTITLATLIFFHSVSINFILNIIIYKFIIVYVYLSLNF